MKKLLISISLIINSFQVVTAQDGINIWSTALSGAGQIYGILCEGFNPNIMYAGSNSTGIWKTTNYGYSWAQSNAGLTNLTVQAVAISESSPNVLYAGTSQNGAGAGIYKSTNGGGIWVQINAGILETSLGIQSLVVDQNNPNIVYAAVFDGLVDSQLGLYKTTNGGASWFAANTGIGTIKNILSIAVNPLNSNVLYCGTSFGVAAQTGPQKIYKSVNGGVTWTDVSSGLPNLSTDLNPVRCLSISTSDTSVVIAGLFVNTDTIGGGMYKTTNGGGAWTRIHKAGLPNFVGTLPRSCVIRPGTSNDFFVGLGNATNTGIGVFRSKDGGATWVDWNNGTLANTTTIRALGIDGSPPTVYAGGAHPTLASGQGLFVRQIVLGTLNITVVMQGFYEPNVNLMRLSDTVQAYLRNSTSPYAIVDSARGIISAMTFNGSFILENATTGTYYLVVKHRNTIETWSSGTISYTPGQTFSYNFTTSAAQAFGANQIQVDASPLRFGIYSGDVTQDGFIDGNDGALIDNDALNFVIGYVATDLTGNGVVDGNDGAIVQNNAFNFISAIRPTFDQIQTKNTFPENSEQKIQSENVIYEHKIVAW